VPFSTPDPSGIALLPGGAVGSLAVADRWTGAASAFCDRMTTKDGDMERVYIFDTTLRDGEQSPARP